MNTLTLIKPHPALKFLSLLQLHGTLRSLYRRVPTVEGLYALVFALALALPFFVDKTQTLLWLKKLIFIFGSPSLAVLFLHSVRTGLKGEALYFSRAETTFLLTAPLSKDALIAYKFQRNNAVALLAVLLVALHFSPTPSDFWILSTKLFLILFFLFNFPIVVGSLARGTRAPLLSALKMAVGALFSAYLGSAILAVCFRLAGHRTLAQFFHRCFYHMTRPFSLAYDVIAEDPQGLWTTLLGLGLVNLGLVVALVRYSSRLNVESIVYQNPWHRQRIFTKRRSGLRLFHRPSRSFPQWPLKMGPLLWVKAHEILRWRWSLILLFVIVGFGFTSLVLFALQVSALNVEEGLMPWHVLHWVEIVGLIVTLFFAHYDFKFIGQKTEIFLSLPISPWKILVSEALPSAMVLYAFLSSLTVIGLGLFERTLPEASSLKLVPGALFILMPASFAFVAVGLGWFLLFQSRSTHSGSTVIHTVLPFLGLSASQVALMFLTGQWHYGCLLLSQNMPYPLWGFALSSGVGFLALSIGLVWLCTRQLQKFRQRHG